MKKIIAAAMLSASFFAPLAGAQQLQTTPGPYVGAQAGDSYVGILGGFQLDHMFSIEAHYFTLDKIRFADRRSDGHNYGLSGVAKFPLNIPAVPQLSVFGKLGVERHVVETTWDNGSRVTVSDTELGASAGVQYDVNQNFNARLGAHLNGGPDSVFATAVWKF